MADDDKKNEVENTEIDLGDDDILGSLDLESLDDDADSSAEAPEPEQTPAAPESSASEKPSEEADVLSETNEGVDLGGDDDGLDLMGGDGLDDLSDSEPSAPEPEAPAEAVVEENVMPPPTEEVSEPLETGVSEDINLDDASQDEDLLGGDTPDAGDDLSGDDLGGMDDGGLDGVLEEGASEADSSDDLDLSDGASDTEDPTPEQDAVAEQEESASTKEAPKKKSKKGLVSLLVLLLLGGGAGYAYMNGMIPVGDSGGMPSLPSASKPKLSSPNGGLPPMPTPVGREEPVSLGQKKASPSPFPSIDKSEEAPKAPAVMAESDNNPFAKKPAVEDAGMKKAVLPTPGGLPPIQKMDEMDDKSEPDVQVAEQDLPDLQVPEMPQPNNLDLPDEKAEEPLTQMSVKSAEVERPFTALSSPQPQPVAVERAPVGVQNAQLQERDSQRLLQMQNVLNNTREQLSILASRVEKLQAQQSRGGSDRELKSMVEQLSKQVENISKGGAVQASSKTSTRSTRSSSVGQGDSTQEKPRSIELKTPPASVARKPSAPAAETSQAQIQIRSQPASQLPYAQANGNQSGSIEWVLKAAQPGIAWLSQAGSLQIQQYSIGDTLDSVGVIQSIVQEPNGWVVRGTMGEIRQ